MHDNLVQFSSKQENQARIITFVNNQYQNSQVSLNYFILSYYFRNITNCINKWYHSSIVSCQHSSDQIRCSAQSCLATALGTKQQTLKSNRLREWRNNFFWQYIVFSTNHLETHAICSVINKIYSNKRMAPNNKWKILVPLKFFCT